MRATGSVGASMVGSSRNASFKRNLMRIRHAHDLIALHARGTVTISDEMLQRAGVACERWDELQGADWRVLENEWMEHAKAGHLRGLRQADGHVPYRKDSLLCSTAAGDELEG